MMTAADSPDGWTEHLEWRPIATYDVDDLVMLRSPTRWMFGGRARDLCGDAEGWAEFVDGMAIPIPGFEPAEWAVVPEQVAFDLAV